MLYKRLWWSGAESSEPCGLVKCYPSLGVQVRRSPCHCLDYVPHELKRNKIFMCYKHMDSCEKYLFLNSMLSFVYVLQSCWNNSAYARWCFINSPGVVADRYIIRSLFSFFFWIQLYAYLTIKYFQVICHSTYSAAATVLSIYYSPWKPGKLAFFPFICSL